jgi:hypothetical protein
MSEAKPMAALKAIKIHAPTETFSCLSSSQFAYTVRQSDVTA